MWVFKIDFFTETQYCCSHQEHHQEEHCQVSAAAQQGDQDSQGLLTLNICFSHVSCK